MDFLVSEQSLTARLGNQPVLASNSVKFTSLTFYFDGSWDGLLKTAYFHQDGLDTPIASILDSSGTCYLPNSLTAGKAWVGLSGHSSDGTKIGTTNKVMLVIHQSAYDDDAQAEVDPSPSLFAELLAQFEVYVGEAEGYADDAESSASSASGSATSAGASASSATSSAQSASESATSATNSATSASGSASSASTSATNAESSRQAIEDMEVEASTGAAYSVATVTKTTEDGVVTLTFVIPKGDTGSPFYIAKTYSSVLAMNADYSGTDVSVNEFVLISTSSVEDEDNAKVYVKTDTSYQFVTDLSGATGIQGPKGDTGDAFTTEMTYSSVSAMNSGYATDGVSIGGYVIISPASTSNPDYGKVYQKGSTEYEYVITMAGVDGNGIASVTKTSTSGLVDTYTISYTDGTSTTYTVTNGSNGINGTDGTNGTNGIDGSSAYEVAVENGYSGTEAQWLASLQATATVVNDTLTSASTTQALSANQGRVLSASLSNKADIATRNLKTYTSLSQIGLTVGTETMLGILSALPNGSQLSIKVETATANNVADGSMYPVVDGTVYTAGTLTVVKPAGGRMVATFSKAATSSSALMTWDAQGTTTAWSGWVQMSTTTPPTEVAVEGTSIVSTNGSKVFKQQNNVATINIDCRITQASVGGQSLHILTAPAGYLPTTDENITCTTWVGESFRAIFAPDGTISIHAGFAIPANSVFYGTLTYLVG